jgi:hypothetical protein
MVSVRLAWVQVQNIALALSAASTAALVVLDNAAKCDIYHGSEATCPYFWLLGTKVLSFLQKWHHPLYRSHLTDQIQIYV